MPKNSDALAEAALAAQIDNAVDATSMEIYASAWGDDEPVLDETGDRSIEGMGEGLEGQTEVEDEDAEAEEGEGEESKTEGDGKEKEGETGKEGEGDDAAAKAAADKLAAEKPPEGKVPPGRLREETARAKAAETERDALKAQVETERTNARKEIDEVKAQNAAILAMLQGLQRPLPPSEPAKSDEVPDIFEDPVGYQKHQEAKLAEALGTTRSAIDSMRVDMSMQIAAGRHGEVFTKAWDAVNKLNPQNPDDRVTVQRIWASPNQGEALVTWHRNQETLREVGGDPAAFKERIAKETRETLMKDPEFRKQLFAELREEAGGGGNGRPANTITRLPRSLNGATGGTSRERVDPSAGDDSQQAIFDAAWN